MIHPSTGDYIWIVIVQLVLAIGIAWIIVQWVKFFSKKKDNRTPIDIAKECYARDEITRAKPE
jgi:uncharacterized membrane protein